MDIKQYLKDRSGLVDSFLGSYFGEPFPSVPGVLFDSMKYSLLAGGKRLRPVLAMAAYEACGGEAADIVQPATALEVIHTYSLIHDDLPAMDDDDLRRGRPTNHKVYGEAIAILAGDGLLSEAFMMILNAEGIDRDRLYSAALELSVSSGPRGMVGGQVQDLLSENSGPDKEALYYIHTHKTGALLKTSVRFGGILAGAKEEAMGALSIYGDKLGLAFQIIDDVLDVDGDEAVLGKPVGSDQSKNKLTYPAIYGIEASRDEARKLIDEAIGALGPFGPAGEPLREIAMYVLKRRS